MLLIAEITTADPVRDVQSRVAVLPKAPLTAATDAGVLRDPYVRPRDAEILHPLFRHHWNCHPQGRMTYRYFRLRQLRNLAKGADLDSRAREGAFNLTDTALEIRHRDLEVFPIRRCSRSCNNEPQGFLRRLSQGRPRHRSRLYSIPNATPAARSTSRRPATCSPGW